MAKSDTAARVTVENINVPGYTMTLNKTRYDTMNNAMQRVLPHLPPSEFPGGQKAGWWAKCVQLDLEAKGIVLRDRTAKPLRWTRAG